MTHGVSREGAAGATQWRRSCGFRSLRVVVVSSESSEKCHAMRCTKCASGDFPSGLSRRFKFARGVALPPLGRRRRVAPSRRVRKPDLADWMLGLCRAPSAKRWRVNSSHLGI